MRLKEFTMPVVKPIVSLISRSFDISGADAGVLLADAAENGACYLKTDGNTKKAARCAAAAYAYSSSTQGEITSVPSVKDLVRFLNKDR